MQNHVNYMKHRDTMHSALNLKLFEHGLSPSVIHANSMHGIFFPNLVAKPIVVQIKHNWMTLTLQVFIDKKPLLYMCIYVHIYFRVKCFCKKVHFKIAHTEAEQTQHNSALLKLHNSS